MTSPDLSQKEIARFFFPLLLNVQLMSVSHSIINAVLARQEEFVTALAGFAVAMVLHLFLASPSYQNHTVTIALVRGRRSLRGVVIFVLLVATYVSIMLGLMAFTPLGIFVFETLLGVEPVVAREARGVLGLLVFLPFFTGFRGLAQGLVIQTRRTGLVSFATGVRIGALFLFLLLGNHWFSGARVGAFALLACVGTEAVVVGIFAWRVRLPATGEEEKGAWGVLRYAFPLAYSSCLQQTIPLLINAIISRLPDGTLALAAFGVLRGFIFLISGPMRNLQQVFLTLAKSKADFSAVMTFLRRTGGGMALIMLLIAFPLNGPVLGEVIGLNNEMRHYLALPMAFCALHPILYGGTNLLRGFFAGAHRTPLLGLSTFLKTLYMLGWWCFLALVPLPLPGIAMAVFLLITSELVELWFLRRQRRQFLAGDGLVPAGRDGLN